MLSGVRMSIKTTRLFTGLSAGLGVLFQALSAALGAGSPFGWLLMLAAAGLVAVSAANAHPGPSPDGAPPPGTASTPLQGGWRAGLLIGALLYLLYQVIVFAQSSIAVDLLMALPATDRPTVIPVLQMQIMIAAPLLAGLFAATLGATLVQRFAARFATAGVASLTVLGLALLAQAVLIMAGSTAHLATVAAAGITAALQGLVLAWLVISAPLFLGIALVIGAERILTALRGAGQ